MGERRVCGDGDTVQRYVDILSDAGFKAVFGDQKNKDVRRAMRLRKRQF